MRIVMCFFFLFVFPLVRSYEPHRIKRWPGEPTGTTFRQYSGHITIDAQTGKKFFYVFVEARKNPKSKPVVLWLNGGPGCSSVWAGFWTEHGPWRLTGFRRNDLRQNEFSWNEEANMLYLESPAGVGFSFSQTLADYDTDDKTTALDNYVFLKNWFNMFPSYQKNQFFISGESYAGHYIPQLAIEILQGNQNKDSLRVNLEGLLIGNPYFRQFDDIYFFEVLYTRYIISEETIQGYKAFCENRTKGSMDCSNIYQRAYQEMGNVDIYDLNSEVCTSEVQFTGLNSASLDEFSRNNMEIKKKLRGIREASTLRTTSGGHGTKAPSTVTKPFSVGSKACLDLWIYRYMNNIENQAQIHANISGSPRGGIYLPCSDSIKYSQDKDVLPLLKELSLKNLRIWLFSGDEDTVVPFSVTRRDVKLLKLTQKVQNHMWYYYDQPGGWTEQYEGLTVLTVHNAGHLVPLRQPEKALYIFKRFLDGQPLPVAGFKRDSSPP